MRVFCVVIAAVGLLMTMNVYVEDRLTKEIQKALLFAGYDPGPADGIMGDKTRRALRKYQQDQGLAVTGKLDDETQTKLLVVLSQNKNKAKVFSLRQICKGTLANQMSKNPNIIHIQGESGGIVRLGYRRDDGTQWDFKCQYGDSNLILLKNIDSPWNPNWGPRSTYQINGKQLRIETIITEGVVRNSSFAPDDLR